MLTTRKSRIMSRKLSTNTLKHLPDPISKLSKIMMSCPKSGLEATLNESGIRISPDLAEQILKKFENAGMQSYHFFEWASKQRNYTHSIKAYHTIISSLAKIRQYKLMWDIVNQMKSKSLLNVQTFGVIMRKYARARRVSEAIYTFNVMDKYGVDPNLEAFNSLLSAFCKSKNVRKAQEIFDSLKDRFGGNSKTYSILLEGWGKDPNLPKAREVFKSMVENGCDPDIVTYGIMVDVLCKAGRVEEALEVVREMDGRGCRPSSFVYSVLIHTYGVDNQIENAIDAFLEMEGKGILPDVVVYNSLIGAFCKVNRFKNVYRVLDEMEKKGITPNARTCNVIINGLIGRGNTDEAYMVFRRMIKVCEPDVDTYTIMIKMFCANDSLDKALKVWRYMNLKKFVPSMHTFSVIINGLCAKEEVSKACVLMEEMLEKGIQPSGSTFGKLRQLLIKEKREDVLEFLIEKMNVLVKEPLLD